MTKSTHEALASISEKLKKLLPHLGNENPSEADNARIKINNLLVSAGLDWHDIASLLSRKDAGEFADVFSQLLGKDEDKLIALARAGATYFHDQDNAAFADIIVDGHRLTLPLAGDEFSDWLIHRYYSELKKAPGATALKTAMATLTAQAKFDGGTRNVYLRAARIDEAIYIDLGDIEHKVVEVTGKGWRLIQDSPVRFRRSQGFLPLPLPEPGGSINQLRDLVNLSDDGFTLFVAWLLDALWPDHPHPLSGKKAAPKPPQSK
jgi:hypothetical protein